MAVCPNCGEDNPDKAKFCHECATPLQAPPAPQAEERKVVSVLFVDLVGFTGRSHDLDPEDVRAALQPYHQLLKREIERFGGTVEKFIGDAVMAVFGAPVAHEDDAERAVRAALRTTEAIGELNHSSPNFDLSIRAAVNTGEGLVNVSARPQAGESMVAGDVVNTASRLQGIAPVNGVAVGEVTYRSTKQAIVYAELAPVTVKGKPEPVPVWRALSARGRFGVDVATRHRTPFVGRDIDLTLLKTTYQRALRESSLQLVTVVGEPGVGKSRLLTEFGTYVGEQPELATWRQGRSLPYGEGITFWALGEIVKAEAGINESDRPGVTTDKLAYTVERLVADDADRAWLKARLAPLVGARTEAGAAEKEESFTAWRRFLEELASRRPLVVVFEDLHWADTSLLDFLEHMVEWSTGVPVLVVGTARPELFDKRPGWAGGSRNSTTISLSPLADSEITELISALLSQAVLSTEILAALLERAGGNPLYAEEFIRMLTDRGVLQQRGRTLALDPGADIPMPDNVQALIAARLDALPPERKSLLHDAAVVGKVFWSGALAALSRSNDPGMRRSLQELVRKELVRPARSSSMEGQREYSFFHALIRDVAYGQIPRSQRASRHQDVAHWLESVAGDKLTDYAELLAHHYECAMQFLGPSSAAEQAARLRDASVRFLVLAGDRAMHLDVPSAVKHYRSALGMLSRDDHRRAGILLKLGGAVALTEGGREPLRLYREAERLFRALGNTGGEAEAIAAASAEEWMSGRGREARDLARRSVALLERGPNTREASKVYGGFARQALLEGLPAEALRYANTGLMIARQVRDEPLQITHQAWKGAARCELGDQEGLDDIQRAYSKSINTGLAVEPDLIASWLCVWLWWIKGPLEAVHTYRESTERAERQGLTRSVMYNRAEETAVLFDLGAWDDVLSIGQRVVRWAGRHDETSIGDVALPYMAQVFAWRGDVARAEDLSRRLLPRARRVQDLQTIVPALAVAALVVGMKGEHGSAVDLTDELHITTQHSPVWRSRYLPSVMRVLTHARQYDGAERFAADIDVMATRDRNCVLTGRAILAEAKGDTEGARQLYQDAAQRWAAYGFVLEEGQAQLGLGRCLFALGEQGAAKRPLEKAMAIFSRLGAVPLISEANGYLHHVQTAP